MKKIFLAVLIMAVCIVGVSAESVPGIARGGTIIARITDEWIDAQSSESIFSFSGISLKSDGEIDRALADALSPDELENFRENYARDSRAELTVNTLKIEPVKGDMLIMNTRRIDDAFYIVIRPGSNFSESYEVECTVGKDTLTRDGFGGEFYETPVAAGAAKRVKINIGNGKTKTIHEYAYESGNILVLNTKWKAVAVIYASKSTPENARIYIGADTVGIPVSGYKANDKMVFCLTLTDNEFEQMQNNASVRFEIANSDSGSDVSGPFHIDG